MSLKKSELRELERERDRFKNIMEMALARLNAKRTAKFESILRQCPDSQCALEAMQGYNQVNAEVDKFFERMSIELHACLTKEKAISAPTMIDCFSKFEYLLRHEIGKMDIS